MKFNVGDKVKVIHNSNGSGIVKCAMNKIGVVKSISCKFEMVYVKFDEKIYSDLSSIGFYKTEIEKVVARNQQLLFEFMMP